MLTVTTSWDDGDVLDERVAGLLDRYGLKGTFYIPREYWGERLTDELIGTLAERHEIGAHTLNHVDLAAVSIDEVKKEIEGSKVWIESIIKKPAEMFCYPKGRYTPAVRDITEAAGFRGARTVEQFRLDRSADPFQMATTVHVYPMPFRYGAGVRRLLGPIRGRYSGYRSLDVPLYAMRSFETAAKAVFDTALKLGGDFHLWGHSWEVEKHGLWGQLENVLRYIGNRADCRYVTNAEIV